MVPDVSVVLVGGLTGETESVHMALGHVRVGDIRSEKTLADDMSAP